MMKTNESYSGKAGAFKRGAGNVVRIDELFRKEGIVLGARGNDDMGK